MEKAQQQMKKSLVWDCGSSLYDSFELKSFERQLDSAIVSSRTLSMPHLSSHTDHHHHHLRRHQPLPRPNKSSSSSPSSPSSKISRSLQKFMRSVFRSKPTADSLSQVEKGRSHSQHDGFFALYDRSDTRSGGLSTIPEVPEMGFEPLPRRTTSQRFTTTLSSSRLLLSA
ncbi:hypothetical protein NE237_028485 [Protea cynaroides]|uniref:Uncharacterized protein n=1 Tax=Protea cynaroides TaxID=273540 RepID=A0A9Q0GS44_9MAGN|nr:hypothetical protein NE237_028485 [Protea cynaroides]